MFRTRKAESNYKSPAAPVDVSVDIPRKHARANGSNFPKVEEINTKAMYAFTFNPVEQPDQEKLNGVKSWLNGHIRLFNSLKYSRVRVFMELSPTGRYHFHGWIMIHSPVKFAIFDQNRLSRAGHADIDRIGNNEDCYDDYANWTVYCLKQQTLIREYLNEELFSELEAGIDPDDFFCISTMNRNMNQ